MDDIDIDDIYWWYKKLKSYIAYFGRNYDRLTVKMVWKFEPSELVNLKHFNEWVNEKGRKNVHQN